MSSAQALSGVAHASKLAAIVQSFPPVSYAFAYGSGVMHQPGLYDADEPARGACPSPTAPGPVAGTSGATSNGTSTSNGCERGRVISDVATPSTSSSSSSSSNARGGRGGPMLDFIFAVEDAQAWHAENLRRHPDHYSWVGRLGPRVVCGLAEAVGVGVHFNPLVPWDAQTTIKYGVIESAALHEDLSLWTHLYVAGRLHKPVAHVVGPPPGLAAAQAHNLRSALAAALVLLPPTFTEQELHHAIVGLSYRGDLRLAARAEDPAKAARIVAGSGAGLRALYGPLMAEPCFAALGLEAAGEVEAAPGPDSGTGASHSGPAASPAATRLWRQAKDPAAVAAALSLLPAGLLQGVASRVGLHVPLSHLAAGEPTQAEVVGAALRAPGGPQRLVRSSLEATVWRSSVYQAAAGLLAAGGGRAVAYVGAKVAKALRPLAATARR